MELYFYIVTISALMSLMLVPIILYRNHGRLEGWLCASTAIAIAVWLYGLAHYFLELPEERALMWARVTLIGAVVIPTLFFHSLAVLAGVQSQQKYFIWLAYILTVTWVVMLWTDIASLRLAPGTRYFHHYVDVQRFFGLLVLQIVYWIGHTTYLMFRAVKQLAGYKRQQIFFLIFITLAIHLTTTTVLVPMQYGWTVPPWGMILMPLELGLLGYAFSRVRLMDFSQAASRVFLYAVTMVISVAAALVPIFFTTLIRPQFFNEEQIFFIVWLVTMVGFGAAYVLPRIAPQVEQRFREKFFSETHNYQKSMLGVMSKIGTLPDVNSMLDYVVDACLEGTGVGWCGIYLEDPVTGSFGLKAQRPLRNIPPTARELSHGSAIASRIRDHPGALVRDELLNSGTLATKRQTWDIVREMDQMGASFIVPLVHRDWVAGFLVTSSRRSGVLFSVLDVELMESIGRELALALHHRRKESQIMQSERLITLGTVAAGIAHEIRNPLASIHTFASLMEERGDDPKFREEFGKIVRSDVERINKVVASVLTFSRVANVDTESAKINDIVNQSLQLLKHTTKNKSVEIVMKPQETPSVEVNVPQIIQIVLNLLTNAMEAVPEKDGKIVVSTYTQRGESSRSTPKVKQHVVVEITDNGSGVPAAIQQRLFQPFFTTKRTGTGLGLAVSQKIAHDHGGFISFENNPTQSGAIFRLYLPVAESAQLVYKLEHQM